MSGKVSASCGSSGCISTPSSSLFFPVHCLLVTWSVIHILLHHTRGHKHHASFGKRKDLDSRLVGRERGAGTLVQALVGDSGFCCQAAPSIVELSQDLPATDGHRHCRTGYKARIVFYLYLLAGNFLSLNLSTVW